MDDIAAARKPGQPSSVGVHLLGCRENFMVVHVGEQGFTHRIGHFEEDVAVALGL